jgi:hypothetical protein
VSAAKRISVPVALLWQLRKALSRAMAICDAVPNRQEGHLGTLVNVQPDGTHGYREIQEAEAALVACLSSPEADSASPPFDHSIGEGRFTVQRGSFWWHIKVAGGTALYGKFHSRLAAEDMALQMLKAFRDGAYMQHQSAIAKATGGAS